MGITNDQGCTTPDQIWPIEAERQAEERQIERIIASHFASVPPGSLSIDTFFDPGDAGGPKALADWLSGHSFGRVIDRARMREGFASGRYSVPDIITSRGAVAKSEFYEIKPDSNNGRREGLQKLARFAILNQDFQLLFFPGQDYDPKGAQFIGTLPVGLVQYELTLKWERKGPGLIVYEICYRIRKQLRAPELSPQALALLLAFLLFVWLGPKIPVPA